MIGDGQIVFLPSSDLAASRRFYGDVLGLTEVLDQSSCIIWRTAPHAYVGVCARDDARLEARVIVTILADDVDTWCERVVAGGWDVDGPRHNDDYHIYHAFIADPDGHLIEIQRFDDPDWATAPKDR